MSGYIGVQPVPQTTQTRESFTATAGQTSFGTSGYQVNHLDVYLNGVKLAAADYTATNGSDVVLASGAAVNDILEIVAFQSFTVLNQTLTGTTTIDTLTVTNAITANSTVDGRDVAADGTKLDTIETNATADQTAAEVRTLVEAATDSNVFTDADHSKLNAIEANATADQTDAEIKTAVQNSSDIALAGNPTTTTQSANNNSPAIATTAYTDTAIAALADSAPATLNTLNELAAALGDDANFSTTVTNSIATKLPLAGGAITGNVTFGDNNKAVFGTGTDFEISSTGTGAKLHANNGVLEIEGDSVQIWNAAANEAMGKFTADGAVELYHNGSKKFETSSTGIDVNNSGQSQSLVSIGGGSTNAALTLRGSTGSAYAWQVSSNAHVASALEFTKSTAVGGTTFSTPSMVINSGGNVGLFGDGGVQTVDHYTNYTTLTLNNSTGAIIQFEDDGNMIGEIFNGTDHFTVGSSESGASLRLRAGAGAEVMRLLSTGNVGIGTSSPTAGFRTSIKGDYSSIIGGIEFDSGGGDKFTIGHASATSPSGKLNVVEAGNLIMATSNTERMRITSGGIVGIGTSTPATDAKLVVSNGGAQGIEFRADSSRIEYLQYNRSAGAYMPVRNNGLNFEWYLQNSPAMTINSSGNVGIGNTVTDNWRLEVLGARVSSGGGYAVAAFRDSTAYNTSDNGGGITFQGLYNSSGNYTNFATIQAAKLDNTSGNYNTVLKFLTRAHGSNMVEALRLDQDQNILVGKTAASVSTTGFQITAKNDITTTIGSGVTYKLHDGSAYKFYVNANGGIYNHSSNNVNLSDQREKKNIEALGTKWDAVKAWSVKEFHYNADEDSDAKKVGVIAQDVESNHPELVTDFKTVEEVAEVKDDDGNITTEAVAATTRKAVKEQQMMWMAIKALQEAQTRIEELETKVAALEA